MNELQRFIAPEMCLHVGIVSACHTQVSKSRCVTEG